MLSFVAVLAVAPIVVGVLAGAGLEMDEIGIALIPLTPLVTGLVALGVVAAVRGARVPALFGSGRVRFWAIIAAVLLGVGAFVAFNVGFGALVAFILQLLGLEPPEVQQTLREASTRPEALPMLLFSTVVVAPLGEELLYRGLLFQGLLRRFSPKGAIWLSALAFAVGHAAIGAPLLSNLVLAVLIFPLGALLAWVFLRWGTLWAPIVLHAAFNAVTVAFMAAGPV